MPRTGLNNGHCFDPEVFGDYMQEQSLIRNAFIYSGAIVFDPVLEEMLGTSSNVGTIPMFSSIDGEGDALNDDGETDNVPTALKGKKQTFMAVARMKSWFENTYVRYLTGRSPLQNLANRLVVPYWTNQWEKVVLSIVKGVMGLEAMATHKTDLSVKSGTIEEGNKIGLTSGLDLGQKALGDNRHLFSLFICHSQVATNLRKLQLIENVKYYSDILDEEIELPTYNGMIVFETDTGTVDTTVENFPAYHSYMLGRNVISYAPKKVHRPYGAFYDDETNGGVEKIFTKQARVYHPNGFSILVNNIAKESPTNAELANAANWKLEIDAKHIAIAELITNG